MIRIVGIVLVRNEDIFVGRAVRNILDFCDEVLLCDHGSTDGTRAILESIAAGNSHVAFHAISHPSQSHDLLKPFISTPTWVFGVDGDEIYDPVRLAAFRTRLLSGEFQDIWRMKGNVLHCTALDEQALTAKGFLAPPSRSITKLYNFSAISSWDGDTVERLHGGELVFRPGYHDLMKNNFQESIPWEETPLRCLHVCFLRRSHKEPENAPVRENIMELYRGGFFRIASRLKNFILGKDRESSWKNLHYRQGPERTVSTADFFPSCPNQS